MKKSFLTILAFIGLAIGSTQAQSNSTTVKENCNPVTCCSTTTVCCEDNQESTKKETKKNIETTSVTKDQTQNNKEIQKEVAIIENKKQNRKN